MKPTIRHFQTRYSALVLAAVMMLACLPTVQVALAQSDPLKKQGQPGPAVLKPPVLKFPLLKPRIGAAWSFYRLEQPRVTREGFQAFVARTLGGPVSYTHLTLPTKRIV